MDYSTGDNLFMLASDYNKCYRDMTIWGKLIGDRSSSWYIEDEEERHYLNSMLWDILNTAAIGNSSIAISRKMADRTNVRELLDHMKIFVDSENIPYENHYLLRW